MCVVCEDMRYLYGISAWVYNGGGGGYNVLARTTRLSQSLGIFRSMF